MGMIDNLSDEELRVICSFLPKKTKEKQIEQLLNSAREKIEKELSRRKRSD